MKGKEISLRKERKRVICYSLKWVTKRLNSRQNGAIILKLEKEPSVA